MKAEEPPRALYPAARALLEALEKAFGPSGLRATPIVVQAPLDRFKRALEKWALEDCRRDPPIEGGIAVDLRAYDIGLEGLVDHLEMVAAQAPAPSGVNTTRLEQDRWVAAAIVFRLADHFKAQHTGVSDELTAIATRLWNRCRSAFHPSEGGKS